MIIPLNDVGKGVNTDLLPAELEPGMWSDCLNFRFRNGFAEAFEGAYSIVTPNVKPYWVENYNTAAARYIVYAGTTKVYAFPSTTQTEITRYTEGVTIASITRVTTTATLTTSANHGRTTGDTVSIWGASPSQYNGTFVITVTGVTTFTYTMASDPGASASPVGLYSYNGATSNFTGGVSDRQSGGSLNGILLVNNPVDGLYYWNGDTTQRLRKVPGAYVADVSRPFKNYIVQLAPTVSGTKYPYRVAWSDATEPGALPSSFIASDTNDAGDVELAQTNGYVLDCLPLGDVNIIYKDDSIWAMQLIGGNDKFRFVRLPGSDGINGRGCVVDTPKGHVYLTQNFDVKIHQGGESRSIAEGRVRKYLSTSFNNTFTYRDAFLVVHPKKSEVWVCVSSSTVAGSGCSHAFVWNWESDAWGIFDFGAQEVTCGVPGELPVSFLNSFFNGTDLVLGTAQTKLGGVLISTTQFFGEDLPILLQRDGLHFGQRGVAKTLQRSRWNFDTNSLTVSIKHGSMMTANGVPTLTSAATYVANTTDFANARAIAGKYLTIQLTGITNFQNVALRSIDLDVASGGAR